MVKKKVMKQATMVTMVYTNIIQYYPRLPDA